MQPTWTVVNGFTRFLAKTISGTDIPGDEFRFYVNEGNNNDIVEWSIDHWTFEKNPSARLKGVAAPGSPISVSVQTIKQKTWIVSLSQLDTATPCVLTGTNLRRTCSTSTPTVGLRCRSTMERTGTRAVPSLLRFPTKLS